MQTWTDTVLGNVLTLQRGFDLAERFRVPGTVPIVSSSGISGYHTTARVRAPGVVTGRYGTLGQVFYLDEDFWPLNTTLWVKDFKGNDPRFISFLLQTLNLAHQNAAGAVPGVNRNALHLLPVRLPCLNVQRRIASILSAYDDLIENNAQRIKVLEEMAQMLYREWFVNFRFPGHENVRMVDSELGPIPEGWSVKPLEEVVEEFIDYRGKTPKKLGSNWSPTGIVALSALNVKQGCLVNLDKAKFVDEALYQRWMKSELRAGDILMTSEAPLGEVYFLPHKRRYCLSQRVFSIRANTSKMQPSLLFFALSSPEGQKQLKSRASGTTVLGIRQADLRRIPILRAPTFFQEIGDSHLRPYLILVDAIHRKADILRRTRDLLLPKLISGEIPVEAADEKAAELMEEIAQPA